MRLGIKGKQVLGVTSIVGAIVVVLSVLQLALLARVSLNESHSRAQMLSNLIYHRAREVVSSGDIAKALRDDPGLRSTLEASLYDPNVTYAAIVDTSGGIIAQSIAGQPLPVADDLPKLLSNSALAQIQAIYSGKG